MSKFPLYKNTKSDEWYERATKVIPAGVYGHLGPAEGQFIPVNRWPRFSEKAQGTYFWDVDGNKYIDYMCAYGPNVLGYCDPDVDAAAMEQMKLGNCTTSPNKVMVECAELLVDTVNTADWAFFAKNGNDATQGAILTARAHTHKKKIIFFNGFYHGVSPFVQKIDYPGVTPEDVANNLYVNWDDIDTLKRVMEENDGEIAALIAQPYNHGNFADNSFPIKGFWLQKPKHPTWFSVTLSSRWWAAISRFSSASMSALWVARHPVPPQTTTARLPLRPSTFALRAAVQRQISFSRVAGFLMGSIRLPPSSGNRR